MHPLGRISTLALSLLAAAAIPAHAAPPPAFDPTPRIGILIPKLPADYALLLDALHDPRPVIDGPFPFRTGTISGIPVVLVVQPGAGEVLRSQEAVAMIHDFNLRALLYPGTSGGHLPKGDMGVGDIVLGAQNVDHGNYYLSPAGEIRAGAFEGMHTENHPYTGPIYADPHLLSLLACSAHRVATATTLPPFLAPVSPDQHPQVFFFGIQGSSTVWSDNQAYTRATMKVFHEIDEDGDWYSDLAATLYNIPFLEVSVISNSIFAFPAASHGTPANPADQPNSHVLAQRLSNRIALDLLTHAGAQLLTGTFANPTQDPFPPGSFDHPRNPATLLDHCP